MTVPTGNVPLLLGTEPLNTGMFELTLNSAYFVYSEQTTRWRAYAVLDYLGGGGSPFGSTLNYNVHYYTTPYG
jgi:hypothetical protein